MGRADVTQVSLAMEMESMRKDSSKLRVAQLWTISTVRIECPKNNDLEEVERNCQEQNSVTESEILKHSPGERFLTFVQSHLLLAPAPQSKQLLSHPLLACNMTAFLPVRLQGQGRQSRQRGREEAPAVLGGFPKKLAGCHRASSSSPRNVSPRQSQDKEYQSLLAPGLVLTLCSHYLLLFLWFHSSLPTPSLNACNSKPSSLPRKLGF